MALFIYKWLCSIYNVEPIVIEGKQSYLVLLHMFYLLVGYIQKQMVAIIHEKIIFLSKIDYYGFLIE
jgi:hypothetical protein